MSSCEWRRFANAAPRRVVSSVLFLLWRRLQPRPRLVAVFAKSGTLKRKRRKMRGLAKADLPVLHHNYSLRVSAGGLRGVGDHLHGGRSPLSQHVQVQGEGLQRQRSGPVQQDPNHADLWEYVTRVRYILMLRCGVTKTLTHEGDYLENEPVSFHGWCTALG